MQLKELVRKQDRRYAKKYKPVKNGGVKGFTRGEWFLRKQNAKRTA